MATTLVRITRELNKKSSLYYKPLLHWPHPVNTTDDASSLIHALKPHLVWINLFHFMLITSQTFLLDILATLWNFIWKLPRLRIIAYSLHFLDTILGSVKIVESALCFFLFSFSFLFFIFSIFRNLGLGLEVIGHISHSWWYGHNIDYRTEEKKVEGSGTKWCHTIWTLHVDLMLYTWSFRVGCTVASTDHL